VSAYANPARTAAASLIFSWAPPRKRRRALIVFLILSLLLHALCFYIFQIVYPPTVALLPPPARVTLISPDNPESLALLRWAEAEDPALATTTQRTPEAKSFVLPPVEHRPSYATHQPKLRTLPPSVPDLSIPSSAAVGPVRLPRMKGNAVMSGVTRKTTALFADLGPALGDPIFADFKFRLSQPDAPANARFRVAIDAGGTIRFCFLIESSGDPALDEQARNFLQLCRFKSPSRTGAKENAPSSTGLFWTTATILWGNDLTSNATASPVSSP
jgi:TonB family protein